MLRFFSKIRYKLAAENKVVRYLRYAIGEIVLVMIGILLALQVNNWNIDRKDRIEEVKYIKNIKLDLQKDLKSLAYQIQFRKEKYEGTKKLISQLNGMPIEDVTELTYNVINTIMEERFTPNNTTYAELESSGNLNLISNDSIKILLLELQEIYKRNDFGIEHETYDYREYISKPIMKNINASQMIPVFMGEKTIQEQNITKDSFLNLFQNPEYRNGIVIMNLVAQDFILIYESIENKSKKIIELINNEYELPL